jgi:HPt (histidine-containing phosphotransfer) domain-containing protein
MGAIDAQGARARWPGSASVSKSATAASSATDAPRVASSANDAIDRAYLARFTFGNADLEREVLELFCAQLPLYLEQLRSAHDAKSWRDAAHSIKGSAAAVGATRLANIARMAEQVDVASPQRGSALAAVEDAAADATRSVAGLFAAV